MKPLIILFMISSFFLSFVSPIRSISLATSLKGGDEAADPMDPAAPNQAPFAMPDADGDDNVLTPATLLKIPEADAADLPLSPTSFHLFSPAPAPGSGSGNPNTVKICQATDNPDLCAESLKPYIEKQPEKANDNVFLLEMEIKVTQDATQKALSMSINPKNPEVDSLKHCKDVYVEALSSLKEASEAIPTKDFGKIKSKLSGAVTNLATCDEGFAENSKESPMESYGGKLSKMVSNCLSMAGSINGEGGAGEVTVEGSVAQSPTAEVTVEGSVTQGPTAEVATQGSVAQGPTAEGPVAQGPMAEGPKADAAEGPEAAADADANAK